jgi:hypothetical protein
MAYPLLLGTDVQKIEGNYLIFIPLFVCSVIAGSFFIGLLRIYSNSIWPAVLAHGTHNAMWTTAGAFVIATSPVADEYIAGDGGILIVLGVVVATALLALWHAQRRPALMAAAGTT